MSEAAPPSRIVVVRASGLGDFVLALPALHALRATFPAAEMRLLGLEWHRAFLFGRAGPIDDVWVVPPTPGVSTAAHGADAPGAREELFAAVRSWAPDVAVQLHDGGRSSNPFTRSLGAALTVGAHDVDVAPLDRSVRFAPLHHEVMRGLEVVGLLGARTTSIEPTVAVTARDLEASAALLPVTARSLAVLLPGAGDPRRRWPPRRFAEVGDALAAEGARVVVAGHHAAPALALQVAEAMATVPIVVPVTGLDALTGLLSRAAVVVANDSGPLRLAAAVGTATVGVFWCGNVIAAMPITADRHRIVVSWRLRCPVCDLDCTVHRCGHDASFVADASSSEVASHARELLARSRA